MRVARNDISLHAGLKAAAQEAEKAFKDGSVYLEKYLEQPRHIEVQILADKHGNVVHLWERDCSLQRRHQKLVEEAPAPFLSAEQLDLLYTSSKAILKEAGYVGAGTCEFLVGQDGTISFLEVNTRLQVEHPVTEEVAGVDLVREMFRIAGGEALGYDDPALRGHSFEFRLNAEDAGRGFLPAVGTLTEWQPPSGPGVRLDSGYTKGQTVPQAFDSLIAKLIVTGATREQALERSRRALAEFVIEGMPTVLPFHQAIVSDPAFVSDPFTVHTRWIETEYDNQIPPYKGLAADGPETARERITVEVGGKRLEVVLPAGLGAAVPAAGRAPAKRGGAKKAGKAASGDAVVSPMQGTIVKIVASEGDVVAAGDTIVVLEAMKMEQPLTAHKAGTVTGLSAEVGQTVTSGATICELKD